MRSTSIARFRSNFLLRPVLFVLSLGYGLIVRMRNILFDRNVLRIKRFNVPVISVGNISVGGSGKTPFTMELIRLLDQKYRRIAVISRGYKRPSRGVQLVSDGCGFIAGVKTGGDEPVLIARKYPHCTVLVSEKRSLAIQQAVEQYQADLILLDDAFQHRWVDRDADIVLISKNDLVTESRLLPLGDLREPLVNLKRANLVIWVGKKSDMTGTCERILNRFYQGYIDTCQLQVEGLVDASLSPCGGLDQLSGQSIIAFAGIAKPDLFKSILQHAGIRIHKFLVFPDHHFYSENDISKIKSIARHRNCPYLLTTEKDLVKLTPEHFKGFHLLAARLDVILDSAPILRQKLDEFIDKTL